ncbi:MAG: transposase [Sulfuricurvum sp.]|nr:transposase [Sulfuricurvum sp.]
MERITEKIEDSDYKRNMHFLSVSNWSASELNNATLKATDNLLREQNRMSGLPTGFVVDEKSHLKKGSKSVALAFQYAVEAGKVDNCQVAVHATLANGKFCTLVGTEIFIPEAWINDKKRCDAVGILKKEQKFATKPQLALKLIKQAIEVGTEFDFIAGNGLYGHNAELTRALDNLEQFYILDVHKDETVFLSEPRFSIPECKGIKGRTPINTQPDIKPIQLQAYIKTLIEKDFTNENVRQTAKGWKVAKVHTATIWHWDGQEEKACKRTLVISVCEKIKFSLSNGNIKEYTNKEWAYFQCSRYWVECCFVTLKWLTNFRH